MGPHTSSIMAGMTSMGMHSGGMQPQIVILKEGTDSSQGKPQLISNINACQAVVECVASTLGPRGMDKLIHTERSVTITNDGATVIKLLDIIHPAAKVLVDIACSQDAEVGDGTTTVTILAGELLKEAKQFVEEGVHPQVIARAYNQACQFALQQLETLSNTLEPSLVKRNAIVSACEAACLILSIDETIKCPDSMKDNVKPGAPGSR